MTLSTEQRQQLLRRSGELRTEVSSLTAERDAALTESSQTVNDAKLIAEVIGLEAQRNAAAAERDRAVNSTESALEIMEAAIADQIRTTALQNAGSSAPTIPAGDERAVVTTTEQAEKTEEVAPADNKKNGGSR